MEHNDAGFRPEIRILDKNQHVRPEFKILDKN